MSDELWTKPQAAKRLGVTLQTVNEYVREGLAQYPDPQNPRTKYVLRSEAQAEYRARRVRQKNTRAKE